MTRWRYLLAVMLTASSCATDPVEAPRWVGDRHATREPPASQQHWLLPPRAAERVLRNDTLTIRRIEKTRRGKTGAMRITVASEKGQEIEAKWKPTLPEGESGWNNAPHKELAAYQIQKWFLDEDAYIVPPTVLRCLPLAEVRLHLPDAEPTFPGEACVLGTLALWLSNVAVADPLLDRERFRSDFRYAYHLATLNVFTYLIRHQDAKVGNFLESRDPTNRRVFSVDNGISFGSLRHNIWVRNWHRLRVPILPEGVIERLRGVTRQQIEALAELAVVVRSETGFLRVTPPPVEAGDIVLRVGLTESEREGVAERLRELLERVDRGEIELF